MKILGIKLLPDAKALLRRVEEKAIRVRVAIKSFEQSKRDGELYQSRTPEMQREQATLN